MRALLLTLLLATAVAAADAGPYSQGRIRPSLGGGYDGRTGQVVVGGGLGYFVLDGLMAELHAAYSFNHDTLPNYWDVSPGARYVLWFVPVVQPYAGVFYRHIFIDAPYDDQDAVGARGGVFIRAGRHVFINGGLVYEQTLDCEGECTDVYPELGFGIAF